MGAIENIIRRIEEDAQWKIREYEEKAVKELEEIRKREEEQWERERNKLERDGKREAESIKQMHLSKSHLEGRKLIMNVREKIIEKVLEEMKTCAREVMGDMYSKYIKNRIEEASEVLGNEFRIVCLKDDIKKVKELAKECGVKVEVVPGDVSGGGIIAMSLDSLKKVNYSIEAHFNRNMADIRKRIYKKLFGEEYA